MEKTMIRLLRENEIECRAATVKKNGVSILLYKDARVDQRILDETFGPFGWKRSHQSIDGNLYCTVEIFDKETKSWVAKQDVGTMGYAEKEKSQASDSFKRACFNWGIGRELYSAPFIWVPAEKANIGQSGDRFFCNDRFSVGKITYNADREICELVIVNANTGQIVYEMKKKVATQDSPARQDSGTITQEQLGKFKAELRRTGVKMAEVRERFPVGKPEEMSEELYGRVMSALARTRSAA